VPTVHGEQELSIDHKTFKDIYELKGQGISKKGSHFSQVKVLMPIVL
jgi:hypothetical protein